MLPTCLVLSHSAAMGAVGRRRVQHPVNWSAEGGFPSLLGMGSRARRNV